MSYFDLSSAGHDGIQTGDQPPLVVFVSGASGREEDNIQEPGALDLAMVQ